MVKLFNHVKLDKWGVWIPDFDYVSIAASPGFVRRLEGCNWIVVVATSQAELESMLPQKMKVARIRRKALCLLLRPSEPLSLSPFVAEPWWHCHWVVVQGDLADETRLKAEALSLPMMPVVPRVE